MGAGFSVLLILVISRMEIKVQKNEESIIATAKKVIGMIDVDVFLLVQILVGICELPLINSFNSMQRYFKL